MSKNLKGRGVAAAVSLGTMNELKLFINSVYTVCGLTGLHECLIAMLSVLKI